MAISENERLRNKIARLERQLKESNQKLAKLGEHLDKVVQQLHTSNTMFADHLEVIQTSIPDADSNFITNRA